MEFTKSTLENMAMNMKKIFNNTFENKVVFLTGHTGFQGSWLTLWLKLLGAKISGFSQEPPTNPSMFKILELEKKIKHNVGDIRDQKSLEKILKRSKPDYVIHLAAQALVRDSYTKPLETFDTNIMGTANLLQSIRNLDSMKACIIMTSDKCYDNSIPNRAHKETDPMGGFDPYSASKGASELVIASYRNSFFNNKQSEQKISTVRAGNVLGGGDWAKDRLIPDSVASLSKRKKILIRNKNSIRPWQFVLEPLSGILWLIVKMNSTSKKFNQSWNIGPNKKNHVNVQEIVEKISQNWKGTSWTSMNTKNNQPHESKYLKLDVTKANSVLKWKNIYDIDETIKETISWYKSYYTNKSSMYELSINQIINYVKTAKKNKLQWAKEK